MYKFIILCIAFSIFLNTRIAAIKIDESIRELSEITYHEIPSSHGYDKTFEIYIKQPINHCDTTEGFFYQRLFLSHIDFNKPVVFAFDGYNAKGNRLFELSKLLKANQIYVEHRCFGKSIPDSLIFKYLNLKQVAEDLHHIRTVLGKLYNNNKWVSTGISKGGQTALYYRYFYPNDVDATVAYVAPLPKASEDNRIYDFLDTVGIEKSRSRVEDFQKLLLKKRELFMPVLKDYYNEKGSSFTYMNFEKAFEYSVMEFEIAFWQWDGKFKKIPDEKSSPQKIIEYFRKETCSFSDEHMQKYAQLYYQAATEMGYYGYETTKFPDLLEEVSSDKNSKAVFPPQETHASFNGALANKVNNWAENKGEKILYIYGENDPWSAYAVSPSSNTESLSFVIAEKNHSVRISSMPKDDRKVLVSSLEKWLDIDIKESFVRNIILKLYK